MTLDEAYEACRDIARVEARNFYSGFILLPPERRAGIYAAYAFSRRADDSVDDGGSATRRLAAVADRREELDACYAGEPPADDPVLVALADTVRRFAVPREHLDALLDGVAMDLTVARYPDFPALKEYCDRVAGAVGLVSLHVFGFSDPRAPEHAADLGVAMQVVNIMRDVAEDWRLGRVYLPQDELAEFGVSEGDIAAGRVGAEWRGLMEHQGERAEVLLREGLGLLPLLDRRSALCVRAFAGIYRGLLVQMRGRGYDVFSSRPQLSAVGKVRAVAAL